MNLEAISNTYKRIALKNAQSRELRVDKETHTLFGVSVIHSVEALGHGLLIDNTTLEQVASFGNQRGKVKSRYTHPGLSADGTGRSLGHMMNFRVSGDKVLADLQLSDYAASSPEGDLRKYVEDLAAEDPEAAGFSIVAAINPHWELSDGSIVPGSQYERPENAVGKIPLARLEAVTLDGGEVMNPLRAVDFVDEPAANRDGMFSADSGTNRIAAQAYAMLDSFEGEEFSLYRKAFAFAKANGIDASKVQPFIEGYLERRGKQSFSMSQEDAAEPTKTTNMSKQNEPVSPPIDTADEVQSTADAVSAALSAEKARVNELTELGTRYECPELALEAISTDVTASEFKDVILEKLHNTVSEHKSAEVTKQEKESTPAILLETEGNLKEDTEDSLLDKLNATTDGKERYRVVKQLRKLRLEKEQG